MQKSKSIFSFRPKRQQTQKSEAVSETAVNETRLQRRSSLDTFIIPGRTRLPSSKTTKLTSPSQNLADIQIAQNLLDQGILARSRHPNLRSVSVRSSRDTSASMPRSLPTPPSKEKNQKRKGIAIPDDASLVTLAETLTHHEAQPHHSEATPHPERTEILDDTSLNGIDGPNHNPGAKSHQQGTEILDRPSHASEPTPHQPGTEILDDPFPDRMDGPSDLSGSREVSHTTTTMTTSTWELAGSSQRLITGSSASSQALMPPWFRNRFNQHVERYRLFLSQLSDIEGDVFPQPKDNEGNGQVRGTAVNGKKPGLSRRVRRIFSTNDLVPKVQPKVQPKTFEIKSFEVICRELGMANFALPRSFATGCLTIPNVVAVTANYIFMNGCNAPGIFRVPGAKPTVDTLYNHFDDPSLRRDSLPSSIEYTLNDVSSLLKKVINNGLPGGLLGFVGLWRVVKEILLEWPTESNPPGRGIGQQRARLIASAILSTSPHRSHLIQALLGLFAFLGTEGEIAIGSERSAAMGQFPANGPSSETMGLAAFATILGPMLLGNSVGGVNLNGTIAETNAFPGLTIEQAQLDRTIAESLLRNWEAIVEQILAINRLSWSQINRQISKSNSQHPARSRYRSA